MSWNCGLILARAGAFSRRELHENLHACVVQSGPHADNDECLVEDETTERAKEMVIIISTIMIKIV